MKTAIDWLIEQTRTREWNSLKRGDIIEEAKEKQKQQIIDAYEKGVKDFANYDPERHGNERQTGDKFYNQKFKN